MLFNVAFYVYRCDLDIDTDFDIAPSFPSTRRPCNIITHLVTSSDVTVGTFNSVITVQSDSLVY